MSKTSTILEAIAAIDETQLQAIDSEIAELESRLTLLRDARKLCVAKLHPDQVKRPGGPGLKRGPRKKTAEAAETNGAASLAPVAAPTDSKAARPLIATIKNVLDYGGEMTLQEIHRQVRGMPGHATVSEKAVQDAVNLATDAIRPVARGKYALTRA